MACRGRIIQAFLLGWLLISAGCQVRQKVGPVGRCAGKTTASESLATLRASNQSIYPLRASGTCMADFSSQGQGQAGFKETFPVRMWYAPKQRLAMFGEIMFDPQALCFAVNGRNFWVYSKHLDIYYYGQNNGVKKISGGDLLKIRPQILLQVTNPAQAVGKAATIQSYGPFDVLSSIDTDGVTTKVFIEKCKYLVRRIEYADFAGTVFLAVELRDYKPVKGSNGNYRFPRKLVIESYDGPGQGRLEITFSQVQVWRPKPRQLKVLFTRPKSKGFGQVYQITPQGRFLSESKPKGFNNDKAASGRKN